MKRLNRRRSRVNPNLLSPRQSGLHPRSRRRRRRRLLLLLPLGKGDFSRVTLAGESRRREAKRLVSSLHRDLAGRLGQEDRLGQEGRLGRSLRRRSISPHRFAGRGLPLAGRWTCDRWGRSHFR